MEGFSSEAGRCSVSIAVNYVQFASNVYVAGGSRSRRDLSVRIYIMSRVELLAHMRALSSSDSSSSSSSSSDEDSSGDSSSDTSSGK